MKYNEYSETQTGGLLAKVAKDSPSSELIKKLGSIAERLHATNMKLENRLGWLMFRDPNGGDVTSPPLEVETCGFFHDTFSLVGEIETHITNLNRKIDDIVF